MQIINHPSVKKNRKESQEQKYLLVALCMEKIDYRMKVNKILT